jgi:16S rRNA (cytosine1402-N4)-methyltransferase
MSHYPVMLREAVSALNLGDGKRYVDCTFGAGGYSEAILQHSGTQLLALDRDPSVLPDVQRLQSQYPDRFFFQQTAFSGLEAALQAQGWHSVDGIVLDVGVSSMQIDQPERGFSFMREGPLDMRMAQNGVSAADVVNQMSAPDLMQIFRVYGEEKRARRATQAILAARTETPFTTTLQLANVIEQALGPKKGRIHPATKIFQALRIFVNDELGELVHLLQAAEQLLAPAGRLVVVAFHSLEDRLVKQFLRTRAEAPSAGSRHAPSMTSSVFQPSFDMPVRKALQPTEREISQNVRSRSARLRWATRTSAPAFTEIPALPRAPSLQVVEAAQ